MLIDKRKMICHIIYFAVPMEHRVKIKEKETNTLTSTENKKRNYRS